MHQLQVEKVTGNARNAMGSTSRVSDPYPETLLSKKTIGREWWIDVDGINRFSNT